MRYAIFFAACAVLVCAPFIGEAPLHPEKIFVADSPSQMVFWQLRLPRVLAAFCTGAILALAGLLFQAIFRNPLTTPFTLGVASGATLGAALAILLLPAGVFMLTYLFSFLGSVLTVALLFTLARLLPQKGTNALLLIGIALSFFYSAFLMVIYYLSDYSQSYSILRFTMGSLNVVGFESTYALGVAALFLLLLALYYKTPFKLLLTSYDNAFLKGIEIKRLNLILLLGVSLSVGVAVSIVGPIGFVGLVIPHVIKLLYKQSSDRLLLPVFFYGGIFLVLCDLIARNLGTVSDLPIGVVTSFIGGPFFIYIIIKRHKGKQ